MEMSKQHLNKKLFFVFLCCKSCITIIVYASFRNPFINFRLTKLMLTLNLAYDISAAINYQVFNIALFQ